MRFAKTHEWLKIQDNVATVGISAYAQQELGEVVYVELPNLGQVLQAGDEVCVLESTKAAADIYAPVSGKVIEVNESLKTSCEALNKDSENSGWLFRIELSNLKDVDNLLSQESYKQLVAGN